MNYCSHISPDQPGLQLACLRSQDKDKLLCKHPLAPQPLRAVWRYSNLFGLQLVSDSPFGSFGFGDARTKRLC